MNKPKELRKGPPFIRRAIKERDQYFESLKPIPGRNTTINQGPDGRAVNAQADGQSGGSTHPLMPLNVSDETGPKVRIVYGTIADLVPSGMHPGDVPQFIIPISISVGYIYFHLVVSAGVPQSVTILSGASIPDDDTNNAYREMASFSIVDGSMYLAKNTIGPIYYGFCGGLHYFNT